MAAEVDAFLRSLPPATRAALAPVREVILANLPEGYEETMQGRFVAFVVPLARFPDTYNGQALQLAALGVNKATCAVYLMCVYGDEKVAKGFRADWAKSGKRLDMGKSCVRFRTADDLALPAIGRAIARVPVDAYLAAYARARAGTKTGTRKVARKKAPKKQVRRAKAR